MSVMSDSLAKFNTEIDNFAKKVIPQKVVLLQKKIAFEALKRIAEKTPVRTGRARGNWQVTIGQPAASVLNTFDIMGKETIAKGLAALANLPPFSVVYITNNVNYISFLEEGTPKTLPVGMVAVTVEELREMFAGDIL